ncbi:DUF433 domain-containing protein [Leptolyngbya sp. AN03gr2]|uniref:DUF433 domain-containing protein n=1 Tax=unclassified Leptolyngbya TaxID=2650499 RepID=UPI003D3109C5
MRVQRRDRRILSIPSIHRYDTDIKLLASTLKDTNMISSSHKKGAIVRTERGLSIAGTRITLYDVMDYLTAHYPPKFIQGWFELTDDQINAAIAYIEAHRAEVEAEYQQVLKDAEELRQYYEEKNRDLIARIAAQPPKPGQETIREKLRAAKVKFTPLSDVEKS